MGEGFKLEKLAKRAKRVPAIIRLPIVFSALGLVVYWIIAFRGPYAWVATFQAKILGGEHYIVLSGGIALLAALIPALIIVHLLVGFYKTDLSDKEISSE